MPNPVLEHYGEQQGLWDYSPELGSGNFLSESRIDSLIDNLNQPDSSSEVARSIIRIFGRLLVEHHENPHPIFVVNQLRHINSILSQIDLATYNNHQRRELLGQLAEMEFHLQNFLKGSNRSAKKILVIPPPSEALARGGQHISNGLKAAKDLIGKAVGFRTSDD